MISETKQSHPFKYAVREEAHRGFVGRQMWCPKCQGILDHRKSTEITITGDDKTILGHMIVCDRCAEKVDLDAGARKAAELRPEMQIGVEVYHGKDGHFVSWHLAEQELAFNAVEQFTLNLGDES